MQKGGYLEIQTTLTSAWFVDVWGFKSNDINVEKFNGAICKMFFDVWSLPNEPVWYTLA